MPSIVTLYNVQEPVTTTTDKYGETTPYHLVHDLVVKPSAETYAPQSPKSPVNFGTVPTTSPAAANSITAQPYVAEEENDGRHSEYVKLVGLPFTCTQQDLLDFVQGYELFGDGSDAVHFMKDRYGRAAGKALVRLSSEAEAKRLAKDKHKCEIGWRYIEVYHIGEREVSWYSLPLLNSPNHSIVDMKTRVNDSRKEFAPAKGAAGERRKRDANNNNMTDAFRYRSTYPQQTPVEGSLIHEAFAKAMNRKPEVAKKANARAPQRFASQYECQESNHGCEVPMYSPYTMAPCHCASCWPCNYGENTYAQCPPYQQVPQYAYPVAQDENKCVEEPSSPKSESKVFVHQPYGPWSFPHVE